VSTGATEVFALLDAIPNHTTHDAKVPDDAVAPYTLVYFTVVTPSGDRAADAVDLTFNSDVIDLLIYTHNVGNNAAAARGVQAKVRLALLNVRPVVAGRKCFPIRFYDDAPAIKDETTGKLIMDLADVYRLRSVPA
jgi:hypothetical protein